MGKGNKIFLTCVIDSQPKLLETIKNETESLGCFDAVKVLAESGLPVSNKVYGGSDHFCLNPNIIMDVLKEMNDDDILICCDAFTALPSKKNFKKWYKILSGNSAIFFVHGGDVDDTTDRLLQDSYYRTKVFPSLKLCDNLFLLQKTAKPLIGEWRDQFASLTYTPREPEISILRNMVFNHLDDNKIILLTREDNRKKS